ncbi:hypothetical protein F4818DRAFT_117925 [Hypoxylon cercidicola]|nr:hypothetical protein F4818DRAFT_117925 [Hypoxylon cercidicola]
MQHSRPHMQSPLRASRPPAHIDNAKVLTSSMVDSRRQLFTSAPESSGNSCPMAGDREPLLGHQSTREPLLGHPSIREPYSDPERGLANEHQLKKAGRFGLPIIVVCRLFNTIFALCTIDKANRDAVSAWNIRTNKLVFDFCWIILVWNIFALAASIVSCVFFPRSRRAAGEWARRSFRDKLHTQFAINDAVLALITLGLLVVACHIKKSPPLDEIPPKVIALVSTLVAVEFLIAMLQPIRFSEKMIFSFC